jgi:hypothetical protein
VLAEIKDFIGSVRICEISRKVRHLFSRSVHKKLLHFTVAGCNHSLSLRSSELSANHRFYLRIYLVFCMGCYYFSLRITYSYGLSSATVEARVMSGKQSHRAQSRTVLLLSVDVYMLNWSDINESFHMVVVFIIVYLQRTFHITYQISSRSNRKQKKVFARPPFCYFTFGNKFALTDLSIFKDISLYIIGASVVPILPLLSQG